MIFNEVFFENNQKPNNMLFIRQAGSVNADPQYCINRQNSPTNVIGTLKHGSLIVSSSEQTFSVAEGHSIYLPNHLDYTLYADTCDPPHFLWMNIRGQLFDKISETLFNNEITVASCNLEKHFKKTEKLICESSDMFEEISELVFSALLFINKNRSDKTAHEEHSADKFENYISNCLNSKFSVKKMAEDFFVSTDTVNRFFLKKYGITPYKYYNNIRLDLAKSLLENTRLSIDDITARLNFSDRNYFTLYFKKNFGITPVAYRKNKQRKS